MRYVTSIERMAIQEGIEQGTLQTGKGFVIQILQMRFEEVSNSIVEAINCIDDPAVMQTLFTRAITTGSLDEFQQVLTDLTADS